jgi:acetyl esterase
MTPEAARADLANALAGVDGPKPDLHRVRDTSVPGPAGDIVVRVYEPTAGTLRPALVYFHGGGYIRGSIDTHDSACRILARASGAVVLSVDYRLAPEAKFPEPLDDAFAATAEIAARAAAFGLDPARIAIGGDSAGGNLAAGVTLLARDRGGPPLAFQLLIYPNVDLGAQTDSVKAFSRGYWLDSMAFYVRSYTRSPADIADPLCSPLRAKDLAGLPPAFVLTCGFDPLRDEGRAYAARLRAAGVGAEEARHEDMIHGFLLLRTLLQEADRALEACGRAVARGLGG